MTQVTELRMVGRDDLALAGGKGANLGELLRTGFPVPDGFVITTDAYAAVAEGLGADTGTRAALESASIPDELRAAIVEAYRRLGGGPVAVRSSATAEDLPGAAFAGQQDTFLGVLGESALLDAVRRCWGSLWTERAVAYRAKLGIPPDEVRIAVVVQRMVEAEFAGVLFTANPVSGDRGQVVIEASAGLGEAVVSGLVTPDHYVLDARGSLREFSPGRREVVLRSATGGGVSRATDDRDSPGAQRLDDAVLAELARLGTEVAAHFGRPQDIEWASADGRVRLLQARPMTAVPPPPVRLNWIQRRLASVLLEYVPVRPYPMDMSTWVPHGPAGLMAKVTESVGLHGIFEDFLREADGVVYQLVPATPRLTPKSLTAPVRLVARAWRHDPACWTADPRFAEFRRQVRGLAELDLAAMSWTDLIRLPRRIFAVVAPVADLRIDYLPRTGLALLRLFAVLKLLGRSGLMREVILGASTRTEDANRALAGLAEKVRRNSRLRSAIADRDPAKLREFGVFRHELAEFLAEYGHRETATPLLVSPPTWGEAPETVLSLVKLLAERPPTPATDRAEQALARLCTHPLLRRGRLRDRLRRWIDAARAGIAFREVSHFYFTEPLPILRRSLLEISRRLVGAGVLAAPHEVFHLRLEEVEELAEPLAPGRADQLRAVVRARTATREELAGVRLIDPRAVFPDRSSGDALAAGAPAGGGTATGPVRIVRDPAEFGRLASGDVLVCPYTNPSWTPLFQRAAAVVVDTGGVASHAAIVAREYGIPAVMGTATGTADLVEGRLVTVDGDRGVVTAATGPEGSSIAAG